MFMTKPSVDEVEAMIARVNDAAEWMKRGGFLTSARLWLEVKAMLRSLSERPASDEVEAMCAKLDEAFKAFDDYGLRWTLTDAKTMLRSLSVDAIQPVDLPLPPLAYDESDIANRICSLLSPEEGHFLDDLFADYARAAIAADRAQRRGAQVEPPLYTISKDDGGNVTVTTTPQVEPIEQTSASPTPASESAPPE
jgi:hypothetical protein